MTKLSTLVPRVAAALFAASAALAGAQTGEIKLAYFPHGLASAQDWVAQDQGFFARRGVNVKLEAFNTGPAILAAGMSGNVQIFATAPPLTFPLNSRGTCMAYLSAGIRNVYEVMGRADLRWPNAGKALPAALGDLKGRSIGVVARGSATERTMTVLLESAGISPKDVTYIPVGAGAPALAAWQAKQVDAIIVFPPLTQNVADVNAVKLTNLAADGSAGNPLKAGMVMANAVTCDYLQKNREEVKRFCAAQWDALDFMRDRRNDEKVVATLMKYMKVNQDMAGRLWRDYGTHIFKGSFVMTESEWAEQAKFNPDGSTYVPPYGAAVSAECAAKDPRK